MPTKANVRVNTINHTTQTSSAGNELNYVEITGFNETDNKGFKKRFFSTKKDGTATKNAETADTLNKDDWIEITMDDTTYQNVQTLRKIGAPANAQAPAQSGSTTSKPAYNSSPAGNNDSDRMSKADWAAKDLRKESSVARSVALKAAVAFLDPAESGAADVIAVAEEFNKFLMAASDTVAKTETAPNGNTITNATPPIALTTDDIPF